MRFGLYITVRTSSSRLPGKVLKDINGRRVIEHDIDRAKCVGNIDTLVVCTSTDPSDDILWEIAREQKIEIFRGSLKDKLMRWLNTAEKFNLDFFLEYDADDLFCDPELLELAADQMRLTPCDYLHVPKTSICGAAGTCISVSALRKICEIKKTDDTESYHEYFTDTGLFNWREMQIDNPIFHNKNFRLTLDYPEDLELFRRVFKELNIHRNNVPLNEVIKFLDTRPDIAAINWFRQEDYLSNQKRLTPPIIE